MLYRSMAESDIPARPDMEHVLAADVRASLRAFPDFPSKGILFQDIAPVLGNPALFAHVVEAMGAPYAGRIDAVAGVESRGFILGAPIALALGARFIPIRKKGKLPGRVLHEDYDLEYARATVEIQSDAVQRGERVLLVDDVLATGGTASAALRLIEGAGARVVGFSFLLEIAALQGKEKLGRPASIVLTV